MLNLWGFVLINTLLNKHLNNSVVSSNNYRIFTSRNKATMKTFKNKNFKKRDYETTNVVFCQAETTPNENWIECDESENNLDQLYIQGGVRYFGYL